MRSRQISSHLFDLHREISFSATAHIFILSTTQSLVSALFCGFHSDGVLVDNSVLFCIQKYFLFRRHFNIFGCGINSFVLSNICNCNVWHGNVWIALNSISQSTSNFHHKRYLKQVGIIDYERSVLYLASHFRSIRELLVCILIESNRGSNICPHKIIC